MSKDNGNEIVKSIKFDFEKEDEIYEEKIISKRNILEREKRLQSFFYNTMKDCKGIKFFYYRKRIEVISTNKSFLDKIFLEKVNKINKENINKKSFTEINAVMFTELLEKQKR